MPADLFIEGMRGMVRLVCSAASAPTNDKTD